ncbi:hypothetical protein HK100_006784 [Physocladia obscura]|uniref:Uncharacterized protein n=1 Tax=Physocladia obscura TaxID=109957 RepID=A0AAD5SRE6_9FUNG|nr:hypothetical protein HK100_006784 [Physocladia obscura]
MSQRRTFSALQTETETATNLKRIKPDESNKHKARRLTINPHFKYLHVRHSFSNQTPSLQTPQAQYIVAIDQALRDLYGIIGAAKRRPDLIFYASAIGEAVLRCPKKFCAEIQAALSLANVCIQKICRFDIIDIQDSVSAFDSIDFITPSTTESLDAGISVEQKDLWVVADEIKDLCGWSVVSGVEASADFFGASDGRWVDVLDEDVFDVITAGGLL